MKTTLGFALGGLGMLGLAWACGGKELGIADGGLGDSGTEDVAVTEDVGSQDVFEAATQDVASEDDGFEGGSDGCGVCRDTGTEDASEGGSEDAGDASEDASDASEDASDGSFDAGSEAGVCKAGIGTIGMGSGGACSASLNESCSNGFSYMVSCTCPAAMCDCSETGGTTGGGFTVKYTGCASECSDQTAAWKSCGFPTPP